MKPQKELKQLYTSELYKVWKNDQKMIDYCTKKIGYLIEYNGMIFEIDKPTIKKDFCFGYGIYGCSTTEDQENAFSMADHAASNRDYFIRENLQPLYNWIEDLKECKNNSNRYYIKTRKKYFSQSNDCILSDIDFIDRYKTADHNTQSDNVLIDLLIEGYKQVIIDLNKRLNTYLKRYGMEKINTWTYLVD